MTDRTATEGPQWQTLNSHLAERRAEEPEDATFQERARMRMDALVEGFWKEVQEDDA